MCIKSAGTPVCLPSVASFLNQLPIVITWEILGQARAPPQPVQLESWVWGLGIEKGFEPSFRGGGCGFSTPTNNTGDASQVSHSSTQLLDSEAVHLEIAFDSTGYRLSFTRLPPPEPPP